MGVEASKAVSCACVDKEPEIRVTHRTPANALREGSADIVLHKLRALRVVRTAVLSKTCHLAVLDVRRRGIAVRGKDCKKAQKPKSLWNVGRRMRAHF